jgi:hypothetical protein
MVEFKSYDAVLLDLALYLRDALQLEVAAGPSIPPKLNPSVPDWSALLPTASRPQAAEDWVVWWDGILAGLKQRAHVRLSDGSLRQALHQIPDEEFDEWKERAQARRPRPDLMFPYDLMSSVAADVAFDRSLPIEQVRGLAVCIAAGGSWWHRPRPQVVVCTYEAALDAGLLPMIMRAVFDPELVL